MSEDKPRSAGEALERLRGLVMRLRAPDGCPWDRKQTPKTVAPYLLEEAFEASEAVEHGSAEEACSELGDLLFQVIFLVRLFEEKGLFDLAQVIDRVGEKMTGRHPHVFGEKPALEKAGEVRELWGEIKKQERKTRGEGLLDSVPRSAPALVVAQRMGSRAARVGFDWERPEEVLDKVAEELVELGRAKGPFEQEAELGDLLFAAAQWARHSSINPEAALRAANLRFLRRFKEMEEMAGGQGRELGQMSMEEMDRLWEQAKKHDHNP